MHQAERLVEDGELYAQGKYDIAAGRQIHAAHAHTAGAAAHHRGDHETAEVLSSRALDSSIEASEKTFEVAKPAHVPMRP